MSQCDDCYFKVSCDIYLSAFIAERNIRLSHKDESIRIEVVDCKMHMAEKKDGKWWNCWEEEEGG